MPREADELTRHRQLVDVRVDRHARDLDRQRAPHGSPYAIRINVGYQYSAPNLSAPPPGASRSAGGHNAAAGGAIYGPGTSTSDSKLTATWLPACGTSTTTSPTTARRTQTMAAIAKWYGSAFSKLANKEVNWATDTVKVML
ncbi:MAG: hypothetical protein DLM57_12465 [Pseudonocardiales bacterium]|nr:MAG: hypothetical protein DLM57_12465 [Pseudonocardiales bacterium]